MQGIGLRLLIALMTFSLGLVCARLVGLVSKPVEKVEPVFTGNVAVQKPGFSFVESTCESGCIETYETADGRQVFFVLACYSGSPGKAHRDMEALFQDGRVIHSLWQQGPRGLHERTVVIYPKDERGEMPAMIFSYRRGDTCFEYIEAGSLELALDFERSGVKDSW